METILRITDISASPTPTRSNRGARAQQGIVAQWLREQATPSGPQTIEASVIAPVVPTARPAITSTRPQTRCGEQVSRRAAHLRSRSRSSRVPA